MKLNEFRKSVTEQLLPVSQEDAGFEADCLLADTLGCGNSLLPALAKQELDSAAEQAVNKKLLRRLNGEPLQYILGEWEFFGLPFSVGEGVLIPRPETEQLVELVLEHLKNRKNPQVLDLCAGSGCIGIAIAAQRTDAAVTLLEKSGQAFAYLQKNIEKNKVNNITAIHGDLFTAANRFSSRFDVIVSNPPYIRTDELAALQREVQREPVMALDGGADGLIFYRAIAGRYTPLLKEDGFLAVEIGEDQGKAVSEIFGQVFSDVTVLPDYSGQDRMVLAQHRKEKRDAF